MFHLLVLAYSQVMCVICFSECLKQQTKEFSKINRKLEMENRLNWTVRTLFLFVNLNIKHAKSNNKNQIVHFFILVEFDIKINKSASFLLTKLILIKIKTEMARVWMCVVNQLKCHWLVRCSYKTQFLFIY